MDITEARECVAQYLREHMTRGPCLDAPSVVREFLTVQFATLEHEEFVVLFLTCQHTLIDAVSMFRGTLAQTSVYPREVVKEALRHNAGAVILAHNHPSGKAEPSRADEHLTQSLKAALALIDVRIIDHFVVAGTSIVSFAERGLL
jgi:DNA repair protein RadC